MLDSGRNSARAEDAQGTPTQSHISPRIFQHTNSTIGTSPGNPGDKELGRCYVAGRHLLKMHAFADFICFPNPSIDQTHLAKYTIFYSGIGPESLGILKGRQLPPPAVQQVSLG